MLTSSYDFVSQIRMSFLDKVAQASYYSDLYPTYLNYVSDDFIRNGGSPRYIFLAPPHMSGDASQPGFLKVTLPFRLMRPDDAGLHIDGNFVVEAAIEKIPATGVPQRLQLNFGNIGLHNVDSAALNELSESLRNADGATYLALLLMIGDGLTDDSGAIQFGEYIREKLIGYVQEKIGTLDVTPALRELSSVNLSLSRVDYRVLESDFRWDSFALMLDFAGSPLTGNPTGLSSYFNRLSQKEFGMAVTQDFAQRVLDEQIQQGRITPEFMGTHGFMVRLSNIRLEFLQDTLVISLRAQSRFRFWFEDVHKVDMDLRAEVGLGLTSTGSLLPTLKSIDLTRFSVTGFFPNLFRGRVRKKMKEVVEASAPGLLGLVVGALGNLRLNWQLPQDIPFRLNVIANAVSLVPGEMLVTGDASLHHLDGTPFTPPQPFQYPPAPEPVVSPQGNVTVRETLLSDQTESYSRGARTFRIHIPFPGSGVAIPEIYYTLPELKAKIEAGTVGIVEFRISYQLPWTRRTRKYSRSYILNYQAFYQFLAPGVPAFAWFLTEKSAFPQRPEAGDKIGEGEHISYTYPPAGFIPQTASFSKKLHLRVRDGLGKVRYGSVGFEGSYRRTDILEAPARAEQSIWEREQLLEKIQKVSDMLTRGRGPEPALKTAVHESIEIQGDLPELGWDVDAYPVTEIPVIQLS